MNSLHHTIVDLSGLIRVHLDMVSMSLIATTIFLYGEEIHGLVKRQIEGCPFLLRILILILVCAFGYGAITVACTRLCRQLLSFLDSSYLSPVVLGLFLIIGVLAERKKAI